MITGINAPIHVRQQRDRQEKRSHSHRRESLSRRLAVPHRRPQDVRDLVLHIIGDAPPPNWVKVEVRFLSFFFLYVRHPPRMRGPYKKSLHC